MTTETSTVDRLTELLDIQDRELRRLDFGVDWILHQYGKAADDQLPVPSVQFTLTDVQKHHRPLKLVAIEL